MFLDEHVRTEFAETHRNYGKIFFFEDDEHVRTEFAAWVRVHVAYEVRLMKYVDPMISHSSCR